MVQFLWALLETMRPKQWVKNGFIFAALVFDEKITAANYRYTWQTLMGFALFCLISGAIYIINDIVDLQNDRAHPRKRRRPLPAGRLSVRSALVAVVAITVLTVGLAVWLNHSFALVLTGYFLLQLAYSFVLKRVVLLDVMAIAAGFVLRVGAGVPLVEAERFSPWLYICMTLLALFLALGKRRGELVLLTTNAESHRAILKEYNLPLLDQLMNVVTSATILAYTFYTFFAPNIPPNHLMMLTIPFVIYGIFRYLYILHILQGSGDPSEVLLQDRAIQVTVVLWGLCAMVILYLF